MSKFAIVENGAVVNIAAADEALGESWIAYEPGVEIGDLYDGETFTKPEPVVAVPQSVTPRQAKLALLGAGLLDGVDAALAAIEDATTRKAAQIEWEYATTFERDAPLIASIGGALELTDAQIDALFVVAKTL